MDQDEIKDKVSKELTKKAMKELKKTNLTLGESTGVIKIVQLGIANGLTDEQIAKQIDDKYLKKE